MNGDSDKNVVKISTKITALSFGLLAVTVLALLLILMVQKGRLAPRLAAMFRQQAREEAAKLGQNIYHCRAASEMQSQAQLQHSLGIARTALQHRRKALKATVADLADLVGGSAGAAEEKIDRARTIDYVNEALPGMDTDLGEHGSRHNLTTRA